MSKVTVHAGDFQKGGMYLLGSLHLTPLGAPWGTQQEIVPVAKIEEIDIATEETVRRAGGVIGWGAVGAVIAGPAGILAAILLGAGKRREVTFVARLTDGRKILATTDGDTYKKLAAAAFDRARKPARVPAGPTLVSLAPVLGTEVFCPSCKGWGPDSTCGACGAQKPRDAPTRAV